MRVSREYTNPLDGGDTLMVWFNENLDVASKFVHYNTTTKATYVLGGNNLLDNSGAVPEQHIHIDYKLPGAITTVVPVGYIPVVSV